MTEAAGALALGCRFLEDDRVNRFQQGGFSVFVGADQDVDPIADAVDANRVDKFAEIVQLKRADLHRFAASLRCSR
jgi:hypothetical protein